MKKEIWLKANYTVTKMTDTLVGKIMIETWCTLAELPWVLRDYNWKYKDE